MTAVLQVNDNCYPIFTPKTKVRILDSIEATITQFSFDGDAIQYQCSWTVDNQTYNCLWVRSYEVEIIE